MITDMGKEIFVAVATTLILSLFAKKGKKTTHPPKMAMVLLLIKSY